MQTNQVSPLRTHAADALIRARKLPVGPSRNDLRQLAIGLLWLDKKGLGARIQNRLDEIVTSPSETAYPSET
jgi:hypothetical protein